MVAPKTASSACGTRLPWPWALSTPRDISARCVLTIFIMFATKTEASRLNMLAGSPHEYLHKPILDYIQARGAKIHTRRQTRRILFEGEGEATRVTGLAIAQGETEEIITADAYLAACDVPGIQRLLPAGVATVAPEFDNIYKLRRGARRDGATALRRLGHRDARRGQAPSGARKRRVSITCSIAPMPTSLALPISPWSAPRTTIARVRAH
jgi:hypothetical protein